MPPLESFGAFLVAALVMELTPGPNMGYLAVLSAQAGRTAGLRAVAGVTTGLAMYLVAALVGLSAVILREPAALHALRLAGVAYMLWLAWDAWRDADGSDIATLDPERPFLRGFLANALNPKAALLYVVLLPNFIDAQAGRVWAQTLVLGGLHLGVSIAIHATIVLGAAHAAELLAGAQSQDRTRLLQRGAALALAAIAVWLFFSTQS
ncbi:MAG: LysE family translocator [Alphaproteobacteria bacterium]|nr:LysE family translocator [Alphaproteobacteria bacterium]